MAGWISPGARFRNCSFDCFALLKESVHKYKKAKWLTICQQDWWVRARYPQFRSATNRGDRIIWTGELQPTARSARYRLEITYVVPQRPEIRVLAPKLRRREDCQRLPHCFPGDLLCVHEARDWNAT